MFRKEYFLLIVFFLLLFLNLTAQQSLIPLNFETQINYEKNLLREEQLTFTAIRPLLKSNIQVYFNVDSIHYLYGRDQKIIAKLKHPKWWQKIRTEDLIRIKESDFILRVNPLINFSSGKTEYNSTESDLSFNTRGVSISGDLGTKFSFGSGVYERQASFPRYYTDFIKERRVVPGQGRARVFQETGFDYSQAFGYLSFTPTKVFNFQIGHGKHFIGEGYRSLILSDNSYNMPYVKFTTTWKWIRYTNLLMAYQNSKIADGTSEISNRRYGSVTSIDFLVANFMEIGLTESIVWQKKKLDAYLPEFNYYNPFILYRTFQYGMNAKNNILLGLNTKIKISKSILTYAQFVFDDSKKNAYQVGVKWYDMFRLPFFMQLEYNMVQPYTYSHWDKQSYTHYNQELAHPLGANFSEFIGRWKYSWKDVILSYQVNYAQVGQDSNKVNFGSDILTINDECVGHNLYQGVKTNIVNQSFTLAYLINPSVNLQAYFRYRIRRTENEFGISLESFYLFGLKTNIQNLYDDF